MVKPGRLALLIPWATKRVRYWSSTVTTMWEGAGGESTTACGRGAKITRKPTDSSTPTNRPLHPQVMRVRARPLPLSARSLRVTVAFSGLRSHWVAKCRSSQSSGSHCGRYKQCTTERHRSVGRVIAMTDSMHRAAGTWRLFVLIVLQRQDGHIEVTSDLLEELAAMLLV